MQTNVDIVLYHNACPDGLTAAYIAHQKYPQAELVALDHGLTDERIKQLFSQCEHKDVLMVDYSLRTHALNDELNSHAKSFVILDHHKTAEAELTGAPYAKFDMQRSGAGLTWDYLFGKDTLGPYGENYQERPWWVDYVEDRDLWRHKLVYSKAVNAFIMSFPFTIAGWEDMTKEDLADAVKSGRAMLTEVEHYVREVVKGARPGFLSVGNKTYSTMVLNVPYVHCSDVGNVLAAGADVSITWFERKDDIIQFSLRSIGDIDVSEIAKAFKGGGHKNAAGFQIDIASGRYLIDTILNRYPGLPSQLKF